MMSHDLAMHLSKQLLWQALFITAPVISAVFFGSLIISVLQVITQIQDSTINFIPKMLILILMLLFFGSWMLHALVTYSKQLIMALPGLLR